FAERFAPAGLRLGALRPCYGLAEATLLVSAGPQGEEPVVRAFDRAALGRGKAVPAADGAPMVGCGAATHGQHVAIVDPDTHRRVPDGRVGELWTAGPSNGLGYWRRPAATEQLFRATIEGEPGTPWLCTGDLAFVDDGVIFIAGRSKDVVIVNGVNLHAPDIELVAQESDPRLLTRATAAFGIDDGGAERIVVVIETPTDLAADADADADADAIIAAVRRAVGQAFDVMPHRIVLTESGGIPKTTSGKVQRSRTRALLAAGTLPVTRDWNATRASTA
ncbi:MAG: AMP-binding protein, partial [Solirubrobacteraceae bacterium]